MKAFYYSFRQYIKEIGEDYMLAVMLFTPILSGTLLRLGIPRIADQSYFLLADILIVSITPLIYSFIGAMVILEEIDNNISIYLSVTPLGKKGYLISRLGLPIAVSLVFGTVVSYVFSISGITIFQSIIYTLLFSIISMTICMLIVSLSSNRVEGMALTKISNILILGFPLPFFLGDKVIQYAGGFLPSFWAGKVIFDEEYLYFIPFILTSLIWIIMLYRRFNRKII